MKKYLDDLSPNLQRRAYWAGVEGAWCRDDALEVIDHMSEKGLAICGVEVWLPASGGPEIPSPFLYTWDAGSSEAGEPWADFVERARQGARNYVSGFDWDARDESYQGREAFFNLQICTKAELAEAEA